jgi:uncharacterized BrkB/YihY/UPF0761 family membrane protein
VELKISSEAESSVIGVLLLIVASLLFSFYTSNFADYNASYGSIGAMVNLMLLLLLLPLLALMPAHCYCSACCATGGL